MKVCTIRVVTSNYSTICVTSTHAKQHINYSYVVYIQTVVGSVENRHFNICILHSERTQLAHVNMGVHNMKTMILEQPVILVRWKSTIVYINIAFITDPDYISTSGNNAQTKNPKLQIIYVWVRWKITIVYINDAFITDPLSLMLFI